MRQTLEAMNDIVDALERMQVEVELARHAAEPPDTNNPAEVGEAMTTIETTKERWFEAEANRLAGEFSLKPPEQDAAKARRISTGHFPSLVSNKQGPGNCVPR